MYNKYRASFSGERRYLSNMYLVPIIYNKKVFKSSESIYMLFKNNSKELDDFVINNHPFTVKKESKKIELVSNWENIKVDTMRLTLYLNFTQHPNLLQKLKNENELIEYNNWGDTFWSKDIDTKEGKNMLGILLQEVKDNLKVF